MSGKHKANETVLVVDDDENSLIIFEEFLIALGYNAVTVPNGVEALNYLMNKEPSCILVDMAMPGMSGLELMDRIRERFSYMPLVAVSGLTEIDIIKTAMQKGAYDYLVKPVKMSELGETLGRAIEHGKLLKENMEYKNHLEEKVAQQTKYIKEMFIRGINAMVKALEARDVYTKGHSERVSTFSSILGKAAGLKKEDLNNLRISALLHDIGKIGVKDAILSKPANLNENEKKIIQEHPIIGEKILRYFIENEHILKGVRNHHERYDGKGYPDGLMGKDIPLFARIISITDAFDALKTDRPYRKGKDTKEIINIIKRERGRQFDPCLANLFVKLLYEGKIIY